MNNKLIPFLIFTTIFSQNILSQKYEVPPSKTTTSKVPWIPDKEMERCVIIYNKAKRLKNEMNRTQVDNYSQTSVDNYNNMVRIHAQMINQFNKNCAGKQSETAHKAAEKLNKELKDN